MKAKKKRGRPASARPTVNVNFRIPKDVDERLEAMAAASRGTMNGKDKGDLLRDALDFWMKAQDWKPGDPAAQDKR